MHALIASRFLGEFLVLRPGHVEGLRIPRAAFAHIREETRAGGQVPAWLAAGAHRAWGLDLTGRPAAGTVLVRAESRYEYGRASYEVNLGCNHVDNTADLALLRGRTLLHTDYNPDNVLIEGDKARLIDWAWPTVGAAFLDPACLVVRLITAGHTPAEAEDQIGTLPAWCNASRHAIDVFAAAQARMWTRIASTDPAPWKQAAAGAARVWAEHRHTV